MPTVIDLNEMFDREDARIDAIFEVHPPRFELLDLNEPYQLMIQFDVVDGIWIELEYPDEDETYDGTHKTCCEEIVASWCLKEAIEKLTSWLNQHNYQDKVKEIAGWIEQNWAWYLKTQENHERTPKSIHDSFMKHTQKELEKQLVAKKPEFSTFYYRMNDINEDTRIGFAILFGDGREISSNGDECFCFQDGYCLKWSDLPPQKCGNMEQKRQCGAYIAWETSVPFQIKYGLKDVYIDWEDDDASKESD